MSEVIARFSATQAGSLPDLIGLEWIDAAPGFVRGRFDVIARHLAPTGYLHAEMVVALADTACGFGCMTALPAGATGFTTAELKANFIGTAREGGVTCDARLVHGGRTTQVWDAEVKSEATGKTIALFRCTQIMLHRTAGASEPVALSACEKA